MLYLTALHCPVRGHRHFRLVPVKSLASDRVLVACVGSRGVSNPGDSSAARSPSVESSCQPHGRHPQSSGCCSHTNPQLCRQPSNRHRQPPNCLNGDLGVLSCNCQSPANSRRRQPQTQDEVLHLSGCRRIGMCVVPFGGGRKEKSHSEPAPKA